MMLPPNFYYIPGYNYRYAMKELGNGLIQVQVYSLVSPGAKTPVPVKVSHCERGDTVYLAKKTGSNKVPARINNLISLVKDSLPYRNAQKNQAFRDPTFDDEDIDDQIEYDDGTFRQHPQAKFRKVWMVGALKDDGNIVFAAAPKQHLTKEAAFRETEQFMYLAKHPLIIVETIRIVSKSKISITDL